MIDWIAARITRWYLTKHDIAWIGECGEERSPDAFLDQCPCKFSDEL